MYIEPTDMGYRARISWPNGYTVSYGTDRLTLIMDLIEMKYAAYRSQTN